MSSLFQLLLAAPLSLATWGLLGGQQGNPRSATGCLGSGQPCTSWTLPTAATNLVVVNSQWKQALAKGSHRNVLCWAQPGSLTRLPSCAKFLLSFVTQSHVWGQWWFVELLVSWIDRYLGKFLCIWAVNYSLFNHMLGWDFKSRPSGQADVTYVFWK